jgi:hypothetical protein
MTEGILLVIMVVVTIVTLLLFVRAPVADESFAQAVAVADPTILGLLEFESPPSPFAINQILFNILGEEMPVARLPLVQIQRIMGEILAKYGYKTTPRALGARADDRVSTLEWAQGAPEFFADETTLAYYRMVYPNCALNGVPPLHFLYSCAPACLQAFYKPFVDPHGDKQYKAPELYATLRPIWYPEGLWSVNLHSPTKWWTYYNPLKYADNLSVEGLHVRDDNDVYPVYGYWIYVTQGTGVFYNLGKTLRARNKIESLYMLGMTSREIAQFILDKFYYNYREPTKESLSIVAVARGFAGGSDLEKAVAMIEYILNVGKDYDVDRINNTADLDAKITQLAKSQDYDSVQFQVQANGMGGWAHEVVFVGASPLLKTREVNWAGWPAMKELMTVSDPNGVKCAQPCEPAIDADRRVITCLAQNIPVDCLGKPSVDPYGYGGSGQSKALFPF